jgi:subtilisin family serine protease
MCRVIVALCVAMLVSVSAASPPAPPDGDVSVDLAAKVEPEVLANARAGKSQRLIVELDISELVSRQEARRQTESSKNALDISSRGLSEAQKHVVLEEWQVEISRLKKQVFPDGIRASAKVQESYSHIPWVIVEVPNLDSLLAILSQPGIKMIHAIRSVNINGLNNMHLIGQPGALALGANGEGTRVAVLDTALAESGLAEFSTVGTSPSCRPTWSNPKYGGDVWNTENCRIQDALNFTSSQLSELDVYPAGYHMMNVAATVASTAPLARLSLLQVFDVNGVGSMETIGKALNWVVNQRNSPQIVAANMSFQVGGSDAMLYSSTCPESELTRVFQELISMGIVPVVASGNGGSLSSVAEPACVPGAVVVGAVTDSLTSPASYSSCADDALQPDAVACFSNGGSLVTLLAPGVGISTSYGDRQSGTSQAAPHVAGAIAILRGISAFPSESVAQTVHRMVSTGKPILDHRNGVVTTPRLQVDAALEAAPGTSAF